MTGAGQRTRGDRLRVGLWPLSLLHALATSVRNGAYDRGIARSHRAGVRVVSVGNLTVGGTGKTPLVVWLVERARARGRRPGVLARGYGRAPGAELNDEGMLLRARFPDLPQVQEADRVAGVARMRAEHDVDLVILDDGFQHRRLQRDFDIVCMDAARPFDRGMLLPAGDLRERPSGLRRADCVVLTRAGGLTADEQDARARTVRRVARRDLPVLFAEHRPIGVVELGTPRTHPVDWLRGRRVHLLSAIARPDAFERTVRGLGAEVLVHEARRDHHVHRPADVAARIAAASADQAVVVVTEKDAVKLDATAGPVMVLRIGLDFLHREPREAEVGLA